MDTGMRSRGGRFAGALRRCGLVALLAAASTAAAAEPLDIETAMRRGESRAPGVASGLALENAAREDAQRADSLPDPELTVGIDNLPVEGDAFSFGADMMTMRRVGLMQAWPAAEKRRARRGLAEARVGEAEVQTRASRLAARRAAAEAWIAVWTAAGERALLAELAEEGDRAVQIAEARLRAGSGTALDALAARAARVELENRRASAEAELAAARASLARWLGPGVADQPLAAPRFDALPIAAERLRSRLQSHVVLAAWEQREASARRSLRLAQAERSPDWRFGVAYGARSAGRDDMVMFEVGRSLPIFPGRRQDRDVAARLAELDAVQASREDAERAQREALEQALARWHGLGEQVARDESELLPLARDRSRAALAAYAAGGEIQPWLQARQDELAIRLEHLRRRAGQGMTWAVLATLIDEEGSHESQD